MIKYISALIQTNTRRSLRTTVKITTFNSMFKITASSSNFFASRAPSVGVVTDRQTDSVIYKIIMSLSADLSTLPKADVT